MEYDLSYEPVMPQRKDVPIGCIGAGFIVADCHLVSYRDAGFNPVALDCVATTLMGFDIDKVPLVLEGLHDADHACPLYSGTREDIEVVDGEEVTGLEEFGKRRNLRFVAHPSWKGHAERA